MILNDEIIARKYILFLDFDIENLRYKGSVTIKLELKKKIDLILSRIYLLFYCPHINYIQIIDCMDIILLLLIEITIQNII